MKKNKTHQIIKEILTSKISINYSFYALFFIASLSLSTLSLQKLSLPKYFYLHSLLQASLESLIFALFGELIARRISKTALYLFSSFVFGVFLVHLTSFNMLRLLDTTFSYLLSFFVGQDLLHVVRVFDAINMNKSMMLCIIIAVALIPILSFGLYKATQLLSNKLKLHISFLHLFLIISINGLSLFCFDCFKTSHLSKKEFSQYKKTLPLDFTFFSPSKSTYRLNTPIQQPKTIINIDSNSEISKKPNTYIFIIETLRKDYIREEIAPFMHQITQEYYSATQTFANANSTQNSWFSIFYSLYPFHWDYVRRLPNKGSPALQFFKEMGYQIHAYSSSDILYFDMDKMLFGNDRELLSSTEEQGLNRSIESWEKDFNLLQCFKETIQSPSSKTGNLFIFFIDATHSEYSFPKDFENKFTPIVDKIDYLQLDPLALEPIKNRYKNAVCYVDFLIKEFCETLKNEQLLDESIIAITGDHGEEFFEEGALFHGTHLNHYQTNVPIILKFGNKRPELKTDVLTHIDIFPSIIDCLSPNHAILEQFEGKSIFKKNNNSMRVAALQNGAKNPKEFIIDDKSIQIRASFEDSSDLYTDPLIEILSITQKEASHHVDPIEKIHEALQIKNK